MALFTAGRQFGSGAVTQVAANAAPGDTGTAIQLEAADGQRLAARWHAGVAGAALASDGPGEVGADCKLRGAIVLAPATGVPQTFYLRFAQWLSARGVDVLRFDFRGTAASRPQRLRGFVADFSHWTLDLDAAMGFAASQGASPVSVIGHSIGGFLAPVAPNAARMHRLVLVGAQSAYWRDFPHPQRWPMAVLWHGVLPVVTGLVGYFPARALRMGEDLPRGVALQWAARPWRDPWDLEAFAAGYARSLPPVHLVAADDDPFATPVAVARVARRLSATDLLTHTIVTGREGPRRIGHFGLFRSACAEQVWPRLLELALPHAAPMDGSMPLNRQTEKDS